MKVFLSPLAEYKLTKLLGYLEEEWGTLLKKNSWKTETEIHPNLQSSIASNFSHLWVTGIWRLFYTINDDKASTSPALMDGGVA